MKILSILELIVGAFFVIYFGFKAKQATGAAELNDLKVSIGRGSFFDAVKSRFLTVLWGILSLAAFVLAIYGWGNLTKNNGESDTQKVSSEVGTAQSVQKNNESNSVERKQSDTASAQAKIAKEPETTNSIPPKSQEIVYTKEQVEEMENKAQYHGDDPVVRQRLGLPPKPTN